ncbi:hypothetical protein [Spiroplasma endosymbiont of Notiophilus biguttatus]
MPITTTIIPTTTSTTTTEIPPWPLLLNKDNNVNNLIDLLHN